ncbi:hypothetical protein KR018_004057, partial [Drosophila ironensis]
FFIIIKIMILIYSAVGTYLNATTLCVFWNKNYDFQLHKINDYISLVSININFLEADMYRDVVDVEHIKKHLLKSNLPFDDLCLKVLLSIDVTHCEQFLVFSYDTMDFVNAFSKSSIYSMWRSLHNKFIFAMDNSEFHEEWYTNNIFFEDQPNILFVLRRNSTSNIFKLKTNRYVGPKADKPAKLYMLDKYIASDQKFHMGKHLFPNKLDNLKGREIVIAGFDYRPYTIIKHLPIANARDIGVPKESKFHEVYIDGTETRVVLSFCEKLNCKVQIDTTDANDWGTIYPNMSGSGALAMVINHKADICIGAMYSWSEDYKFLDLSMYLVRSGITCLVPAPLRLASWYLPLEPFQKTLWAAILVYLFIETIGLVIAYMSEQKLCIEGNFQQDWCYCTRFGMLTTFKLFLSQSENSKAKSLTVRVLLFACFLNDLIITSIYGGGLASILTIPSLDEAADTIHRLHSHQLQWAANSEAWVSSLRGSNESLVKDLLNNFHIYSDDHLKYLAQEKHVRIGFTVERLPFGHFAIGDYLVPQAIDQLVIMQEDLYFQYTVAFVPKLWPLLEKLNFHIYNWHSSGLDKYWEYRVVADNMNVKIQKQVENTMCQNQGDIGPVTLGMSNFSGILLVWLLGSTMATVAFVLELVYKNIKPKTYSS